MRVLQQLVHGAHARMEIARVANCNIGWGGAAWSTPRQNPHTFPTFGGVSVVCSIALTPPAGIPAHPNPTTERVIA